MASKIPLLNMIMFFIAIQAALVIISLPDIDQPATFNTNNLNSSMYSTNTSVYGIFTDSSVIWDTIIFPARGNSNPLITYLITFALLISAIALVARIDTGVWSGMFMILVGFGAWPISNLYTFLNSEIGRFACSITPGMPGLVPVCWPAGFVAMIACGLLSIFWVWGCISWWSNRYD